jgi:Protein of unknown function (DUF3142).
MLTGVATSLHGAGLASDFGSHATSGLVGASVLGVRLPIVSSANPRSAHPPVMLWAWEAPSRLEWIDPAKVGVAFLSETITLSGNSLESRPRMQPLVVPPKTYRMAVVRIERYNRNEPSLSEHQLDGLVYRVLRRAKESRADAIQIDFDARKSEREFYSKFLTRLRKDLPAPTALSMTALASWCIGDGWLDELSVDEIVPMFFSMGVDKEQVLMHLRDKGTVRAYGKRLGIGIADDSEMNDALANCRARGVVRESSLYLFSGRAWTEVKARRLLAWMGM